MWSQLGEGENIVLKLIIHTSLKELRNIKVRCDHSSNMGPNVIKDELDYSM